MPPPRKAAPAAAPAAPSRRLSTGDLVAGSLSDSFIFQRRSQIVTVRVDRLTVRDDHESDEAVMAELSDLLLAGMDRIKGDYLEAKLEGQL